MSRLTEKIKLPLAVILSAALIIGFSAVVGVLYQGRFSALTAVTESKSEIATDSVISVSEALSEVEDLFIPEKIAGRTARRTETTKCKQYTEYTVFAEDCTVTVRQYNYAYLTEDDSFSFPADTEIINVNGIEVFTFLRGGKENALYYKGLSRYIIESDINIFS